MASNEILFTTQRRDCFNLGTRLQLEENAKRSSYTLNTEKIRSKVLLSIAMTRRFDCGQAPICRYLDFKLLEIGKDA